MSGDIEIVENEINKDEAARSAVYSLLAKSFDEPDRELYEAYESGGFESDIKNLIDETKLDIDADGYDLRTDDDYETLCARFNDVFEVGYPDPPVPLYETEYRDESWNDINIDLARAYEYFGLSVDDDERDHHDSLVYELEFAAFLARRASVTDEGSRHARRDFLERHLRVVVEGLRDRTEQENSLGIYAGLVRLLDEFSQADFQDLR